MHVSIVEERRECFETEKHASHSKEYTEGKSSQNLLLHQNFLEELQQQTIFHDRCRIKSVIILAPHVTQSLTRCTISSRLRLNFKPLHFNHCFSWSTVYSSGFLSNFRARNAVIFGQNYKEIKRTTRHFPLELSKKRKFVCLSPRGGLKFHDVISAKRYRLVSLNGKHNFNREQTRLYT